MSTSASKTNGKRVSAPVCRHSPGCEVVTRQDDLRAVMEAQFEALRKEMLEQRTTLQSSLMQQNVTIDHDRAKWIETHEETRRQVMAEIRELVSEIRELGVLVRALSRVIETRPCLAGAVCGQEG